MAENCAYLVDGIHGQRHSLKEITEHLETCEVCAGELREAFYYYSRGGSYPLCWDLQIPEGISTQEEFLKRCVTAAAALAEDEGFSEEIMHKKLNSQEVKLAIHNLLMIQTRAIQHPRSIYPRPIVEDMVRQIGVRYRELLEVMGPRAFWCYIGSEVPHHGNEDQFDVEELIDWWRKAVLGTE